MKIKPRNGPFTARMNFDPDSTDVGVQIVDYPDVIRERTAATQIAPGIYEADLIAPSEQGEYAILWDSDGDLWRWEDLKVTGSLYTPGGGEPEPEPDSTDALEELSRLVAADQVPTLDAADLQSILGTAVRPDSDGRPPSHAEWVPTYDLNAAAAEGWQRKAGLAASKFDFAEDDQRFNVGQIHNHCIAQARLYRNRAGRSVRTSLAFDA